MGSILLVVLILAAAAPRPRAQSHSTPAPTPPASQPGSTPSATAASGRDIDALIEAARARAKLGQDAIKGRLDKILPDLALPWDSNRDFLKDRFKEVVDLGPEVAPLLMPIALAPAREPNDEERARNAARILVMVGVAPYSDALLQALPGANTHTKAIIVRLLATTGDHAAVPALREIVQSAAGAPLLVEAIDGLAQLSARTAVGDVLAQLHKDDKRVRKQALRALQALGSADVVEPTLAALRAEKDPTLFPQYLDVLVAHARDSASTAETLIPFLTKEGLPESGAEDILRALGVVAPDGHKASLEALRNALKSTQQQVVKAAALAMLQLGDASGTKVVLDAQNRFVQQNPRLPRAWLMRADQLLLYGRHGDALKDYREAVRLSPRGVVDPPVHVAMARCFAKAKAWGDVIKSIKAAALTSREMHDAFDRYPELREAAEQNAQVKKLIEG